ncbi:hypothetical protein [Parasitella parasitica]|uniref:Uncharacterized protein n=1 Tax=Parasitella parasitica TaxID=35722 RepID=A0A0B7MU98_9FUNG|nr:hypothetical protein [Parasitella parasitica]
MALFSKKQKPTGTLVPGQKGYAAAAKTRITTTSQSLMHGEATIDSTGTPTASTTHSPNGKIKTRIWRNARTDNGYFLDISKIANTTEQQHLQILNKQYPASNFYGIKFLGKHAQRYIEVYPNPDIVDRFLAEGVLYEFENSK